MRDSEMQDQHQLLDIDVIGDSDEYDEEILREDAL